MKNSPCLAIDRKLAAPTRPMVWVSMVHITVQASNGKPTHCRRRLTAPSRSTSPSELNRATSSGAKKKPATAATSYDVWSNSPLFADEGASLNVAGLHFIDGFSTTSHWGNMYSGSKFAIEVDGNRNVYVIDLATGSRSVIEGFTWPELDYPEIQCIPSPDGEKLLIACRTQPTWYDHIGVLDFSRKTYTEFSRENPNPVNEHTVYWYDCDSIVIATSDLGSMKDYYIYRLLN